MDEITDAGAEAFPRVAVALAKIDTLDADAATSAVDGRGEAVTARLAGGHAR